VLDIRELGRRPGSQRKVTRTVPAPAGLGIEVLRVPEGSHRGGEATPADPEDDETSRLEGDLLDLEPLLRDAVVLALPFQPLCEDDCPGLCTECGARLADDPDHAHEAAIDPRWAGLQQLQQGDD
jgi:uncharacterized protein